MQQYSLILSYSLILRLSPDMAAFFMLLARESWAGPANKAIDTAVYLCIELSAPEYAACIKDAISSSC